MDDLTILTECALFHGLREAQIREMLPCLSARQSRFRRGQFLLRAGDRVAFAGILLSGEAEVLQEDFWGNRNLVAKIEPGDVFAETFACMQRRNINVSVIAEDAANVLWLNVRNILDADGETEGWKLVLLRNLLENMAEKNLRFNEKLTHMGKRNTREKLLSYLSAEAQKHGTSEFDIPFSRQQLAENALLRNCTEFKT